jgi:hypothetical protein
VRVGGDILDFDGFASAVFEFSWNLGRLGNAKMQLSSRLCTVFFD